MTEDEALALRDCAKDDEQAVLVLREAAEAGDAWGQYYLGSIYHHGYGVARDESLAARWCRKAAEQGLVAAQCVLAWQYANRRRKYVRILQTLLPTVDRPLKEILHACSEIPRPS